MEQAEQVEGAGRAGAGRVQGRAGRAEQADVGSSEKGCMGGRAGGHALGLGLGARGDGKGAWGGGESGEGGAGMHWGPLKSSDGWWEPCGIMGP